MHRKVIIYSLVWLAAVLPVNALAAGSHEPPAGLEVLTLDQCLELAYQNSKLLKSAAKAVEIAELQLQGAEEGLMPTARYSISTSQYSDATPQTNNSIEGSNGSISVTQPLYTGGVLSSRIKIAEINLENALEEQRKTKQQVTFNVKQAYYQVWVAEQLYRLSKSSYENMGAHYQQVKHFYQVGTKSKFDLLQAQVQWEGLKPQVIKNENQWAYARLNLATLLGIDKNRQFTVLHDPALLQLPEKVDISLRITLEKANRDRPEMRRMKNLVAIYENSHRRL